MADKIVELSRGLVVARGYGFSKCFLKPKRLLAALVRLGWRATSRRNVGCVVA
jgi:hypothetical protein